MPIAYIFSGLPGTGKTTLSQLLAKHFDNTSYYRVDTVEYFLKKEYQYELTKQGYEIIFRVAKDNLELDKNVIIDCCNPIQESRTLWNNLANVNNTQVINIEIVCSDKVQHKLQVEDRYHKNPNKYPSWQDVINREYEVFENKDITIDTAYKSVVESLIQLTCILSKTVLTKNNKDI